MMWMTKRHRPFGEAGVAAIEFALVAPIFLILMFGIVVYGFYFGTCIALPMRRRKARAHRLRE